MSEDTQLLQDILTAEVLILSKLMDTEKLAGGTQKFGGDYTDEAIKEIRRSRGRVIQKYLSAQ